MRRVLLRLGIWLIKRSGPASNLEREAIFLLRRRLILSLKVTYGKEDGVLMARALDRLVADALIGTGRRSSEL